VEGKSSTCIIVLCVIFMIQDFNWDFKELKVGEEGRVERCLSIWYRILIMEIREGVVIGMERRF
jgi:hypothetical protein